MDTVSLGHSLPEMSNPVFLKKIEKTNLIKLSSAKFARRVVKVKDHSKDNKTNSFFKGYTNTLMLITAGIS